MIEIWFDEEKFRKKMGEKIKTIEIEKLTSEVRCIIHLYKIDGSKVYRMNVCKKEDVDSELVEQYHSLKNALYREKRKLIKNKGKIDAIEVMYETIEEEMKIKKEEIAKRLEEWAEKEYGDFETANYVEIAEEIKCYD